MPTIDEWVELKIHTAVEKAKAEIFEALDRDSAGFNNRLDSVAQEVARLEERFDRARRAGLVADADRLDTPAAPPIPIAGLHWFAGAPGGLCDFINQDTGQECGLEAAAPVHGHDGVTDQPLVILPPGDGV